MQLGPIKFVLLALLLSIAVGLSGSAISKSIVIDPQINRLGLSAVARDGWMESRAQIDLSKYERGVSKILFNFDSWRPKGQSPAKISFQACGKEISTYRVEKGADSYWLPIPTDCAADSIDLVTKNPFRSPDGRMLGLKLNRLTLKYSLEHSLKFDVVAQLAICALLFLFLSLYYLRLPAILLLVAMISFSVLGLYAMRTLVWDNQWQLFCLAITLSLFALGLNPKFVSKLGFGRSLMTENTGHSLFTWAAIVFVCGAIIRFYGCDFGLPNHYHPDEPRKAQIALRMAQDGNLDPNYFLHPTLLLYLTALYAKIGHILGFFSELNITSVNYSGRLVSATAGALAVPVLYLIGSNLFSYRVGLLSSAVFAFAPLSVTCSRYLKEDSLLTFFALLTAFLCIRAVKRDCPRELLLASFVAGLSTSSKYSGAMSCVAIFLTPWLKSRSLMPDARFFMWGLISAIFVPVGFILASPYVVLNSEKFWNHFNAEQEHMIAGHHKIIISSWSQYWMYHLSRSVIPAVTWPIAIAGIFGFGLLLRVAGIRGFYVLAMFIAFYFPAEAVNAKPPPQPERYILPCVPFLVLASAFAAEHFRSLGFKKIGIILAIILFIVPCYRSVGLTSEIYPDTRVMMREWISQNIPKGSKIEIDAQAYSAFLRQDLFNIVPMWTIPQRREMTYEQLKADGIDYLLLTNKSYERYFLTQSADQLIRLRFEDVFNKWLLVKEFKSDFGNYGFSNPDLSLYKVELLR